ncbi:hypothetical protein [Lacipirellula sp.]|uniref:hypothetical protein n=1 Tax=Lacipirellula sp. TaxID=2691419 RepID=UPI003D1422CA
MSGRFASSLLAVVWCSLLGNASVYAVSYELRGVGTLPSSSSLPAGVAGEGITVSVMLDSDDFTYLPTANEIFHYFVPNTTIPVSITGSLSGAYPNVSPIGRFIALELTDSGSSKDQIALGVEMGNSSTSLFTVYANDGDGFDGDLTPFTSTQLFALFAEAMQNQAAWSRSNSAVFIGSADNLLYLGDLDWNLIDPNEPPTQQVSIAPSFDVQLKPGNAYPLGNATAATLDIDGGSGTSFPILDVLMDFPLSQIPAGANITSAKLKLDATTSTSGMTIQALGYAGDGLASLGDESAVTSVIGNKVGPFTSAGDITIDLDTNYIESLLGGSSHLGLRLRSTTAGPYVRIATSEHLTATAPRLVLEFSTSLEGDFDLNGVVDGADFLAWQRGASPAPLSAADLAAWKANFGASAANSTAAAVPEPGAFGMLITALLASCCGRRS